MKTYSATKFGHAFVVVDHLYRSLPPRLDLRNHSPTGYGWGYFGSGPTQFALAILCDALGDERRALGLYQRFRDLVIAPAPQEVPFEITHDEVLRHVATLERTAEAAR